MSRTGVSSRYQVLISKDVRESLDLQVGQELQIVSKGRVIMLVPDRPLASLRGFAKGLRPGPLREKKDRM
jgi:bifunctional DNA-binding transcriptional regulator/antitoxin component of YhaV-PrlF toxin-antitoxin module